jgi:hypothetical protein
MAAGVASAPTPDANTGLCPTDNKEIHMRTKSKVTTLAAGLSLCALTTALPLASVSAAPAPSPGAAKVSSAAKNIKKTLTNDAKISQPVIKLDQVTGQAVMVATEVDCNSHRLTARVTNTTAADITPRVTFNTWPASYDYAPTIKPGKTASYQYNFSGNQLPVAVKAAVDGHEDALANPTVSCTEPVTFRVDGASSSTVTGYLQNNSTLLPQTVLMRVGSGDVRTETLAPGESRLVGLPFSGFPNQKYASVTIAVVGGYESTYNVNLEQPQTLPPVVPLPM